MANLTKKTVSGGPSLAVVTPPHNVSLSLPVAEAITVGDMVYINSAGQFAKANGTAANALAQWWGMAASNQPTIGESLTAHHAVEYEYSTAALTPGARYYLATTAGLLSDTATTGGDIPCAFATSVSRLYVMAPRK